MNATAIARDGLNTIDAKRPLTRAGSLNTTLGAHATLGANALTESFGLNAARVALPTATGLATPGSFRAAMDAVAAAKRTTADAGPESPEDAKLRATAETLVNQFFMGSMLKQMRSSPFKDSTFSGGKAGDAYAGLFDQHLSAKAGGGMGKGLVDVMVKHLKGARGQPMNGVTAAQAEHLRNRRKAQQEQKEQSDAAPAVDRAA